MGRGGPVAVTTPSTRLRLKHKAPACILSGKGSCRPSSEGAAPEAETSKDKPSPGLSLGAQRALQAPTPRSTLNLAPERGAAHGQSGTQPREQGRAGHRPQRGEV